MLNIHKDIVYKATIDQHKTQRNGFRTVIAMSMRHHLVECLEKEEILPFPCALQKATAVRAEKQLVIQTHCICHLPECGEMVQCDLCGGGGGVGIHGINYDARI